MLPILLRTQSNDTAHTQYSKLNFLDITSGLSPKSCPIKTISKNALRWESLIKYHSSANNSLTKLAMAILDIESGGNPHAVSKAGAQGLMQLMPKTGREILYSESSNEKYDPFNPAQNIRISIRFINRLSSLFPQLELVIAAYNAGPGRVSRLLLTEGTKDYESIKTKLPQETRNYVTKVLCLVSGIKPD